MILLAIVLIARCASQRAVVVPVYERSLPASESAFVKSIACRDEFANSWAAVVASYQERDYTFEEFSRALQSLETGVARKNPKVESVSARETEIPLNENTGGTGQPLILYLDPTCGECARIVALVLNASKHSRTFPPVVARLMPSGHAEAVHAANALEFVREHDPRIFPSALIETLQLVPEGKATFSVALAPYLPNDSRELRDPSDTPGRWIDDVRSVERVEVGAPFGVYRGRLVTGYRDRGIPYDTFRDSNFLRFALDAIDAADGAVRCEPR